MKQRDGAKSARSKGAEQESHNLVSDLLRRAGSPEVLAGIAGAAAAARLTKHAFEHSDDDEPETSSESEEAAGEAEVDDADDSPRDEAEPQTEDEAEPEVEAEEEDEDEPETEDEGEPDDEDEAEPETDDEAEAEDEDEDESETEDEADPESGIESEQDGPRADEESETPSDRSPDRNGSLGNDDRMQLLARAREYAEELTGHAVESFSGLAPEEQGWRVGMEVVEVARVPSTTDVLASYEVVLTEEGELVDFRRAGRYYRNATDGDAS
jgi:Gas vesicle synthesis protein GvpO